MGRFDADLVALESRHAIIAAQLPVEPGLLSTNGIGAADLARPVPSLADYDKLLAEVSA
jgi:hypothetical protein